MSRIAIVMVMALMLAACDGHGSLGMNRRSSGGTPPVTNGAPTVTSASFELDHDSDLSATLTATDPEGETVTFAKSSDPVHGQIVSFAESGAFTYRPDAGFAGTDAFGVLASDGSNAVAATITLNVRATGQALSFAQAGPVNLFVGDTLSNPASGPGTGAVTYSSSDPSIATVDGGGLVRLVGAGDVQINADKAADTSYVAAHASYSLHSAEVSIPFTSWTGLNDSLVTFPETAAGLEFYRSSAPDCDLQNYASCADGQMDILTTAAVTDTAANLNRPGYYSLRRGVAVASVANDAARFSARRGHQVVTFANKLWLIGGKDRSGSAVNDVWMSNDGVIWAQRTASAAFSGRSGHQVVVFRDQLWLIGGLDSGGRKNDVWSSSDGSTWTQQTAGATFSPRSEHQVVTFADRLWLIGGLDNSGRKNDVWSSSDGITWTRQTASAAFSPRSEHQVVTFADRLWLIGGLDSGGRKNDVWSSSDGITWTQQTAAAAFLPVSSHQVVVYDQRLWLIDGDVGSRTKAVWSSADGVTWTRQTGDAAFPYRFDQQVVVHAGRMWLIGGYEAINGPSYKDDVWSSNDGIAWDQQTVNAAFSGRFLHEVVAFKGRLWLVAGHDGGYKNDVWSSGDGIAWTRLNASAPFSARAGHQVVVHDDQLWLIGGVSPTTGLTNDVWSSSDGITWIERTPAAAFPARYYHQALAFDGRLWVIGGADSAGKLMNDVWSSSDGITWTQQTAHAAFSPRINHQSVVFDGRMWVIGGNDGNDDLEQQEGVKKDVWSSGDGITWTRQTASAAFSARALHQVAVLNDRMWLIGGYETLPNTNRKNDVWSSSDGITWTLQVASADFPARFGHQLVANGQELWLIGGQDDQNFNDIWRSTDGIAWRSVRYQTFHFR